MARSCSLWTRIKPGRKPWSTADPTTLTWSASGQSRSSRGCTERLTRPALHMSGSGCCRAVPLASGTGWTEPSPVMITGLQNPDASLGVTSVESWLQGTCQNGLKNPALRGSTSSATTVNDLVLYFERWRTRSCATVRDIPAFTVSQLVVFSWSGDLVLVKLAQETIDWLIMAVPF